MPTPSGRGTSYRVSCILCSKSTRADDKKFYTVEEFQERLLLLNKPLYKMVSAVNFI